MATFFDTHQAVKDLTAAQLSDEQAEAIVRLWQQAREADFSELATKNDLRQEVFKLERRIDEVEQKLERRIDEVEQKLERRIDGVERRIDRVDYRLEAMENRLLVRLGGLMAAGMGIIAVLVGIF